MASPYLKKDWTPKPPSRSLNTAKGWSKRQAHPILAFICSILHLSILFVLIHTSTIPDLGLQP